MEKLKGLLLKRRSKEVSGWANLKEREEVFKLLYKKEEERKGNK